MQGWGGVGLEQQSAVPEVWLGGCLYYGCGEGTLQSGRASPRCRVSPQCGTCHTVYAAAVTGPFDLRGFHHLIYHINGELARAAPENTAYVGGVLLQNCCL